MTRCLVSALSFALVALAPAVSSAADACPDGWFCESNAAPQPAAPNEGPAPSPAPQPGVHASPGAPPAPPGYTPPAYPPPGYAPPAYPAPPNPKPAAVVIAVPPDAPPRKHRRHRGFREWGFNLHLEGALLDNHPEHVDNTMMGGLGFGFRYRPLPPLAFEAGVDLLRSSDKPEYSRREAAFLLNTLLFFNPHDVLQFYALAGLGFSGADVSITPSRAGATAKRYEEHYSYFGGQLGLGLEVRVSRHIAIAADLLGFLRGRSDEHEHEIPEYIDSDTIRSSRTSGGGLLRGGITFYW